MSYSCNLTVPMAILRELALNHVELDDRVSVSGCISLDGYRRQILFRYLATALQFIL